MAGEGRSPLSSRSRHARAHARGCRSAASLAALCIASLACGAVHAQTPPAASSLDVTQGDPLAPTLDPVQPGALDGTTPSPAGAPAGDASPADDTNDGKRGKITLRATGPQKPISSAKLRQGPPQLPPLEAYARSLRLRGSKLDTAAVVPTTPVATPPGPTVAAVPSPLALRHAKPDADPFAPVGYSLGSLRLNPYFEQSLGFDSNPDQVATGVKPSAFSRTEGGFDLLSLWSANQLKATMHAGYDEFFSDPSANRPDAAGVVDYRFDATRNLAFDTEGRFSVSTQRPGSPDVNAAVTERPLVTTYGATVGGSDTLGRLTLGLHGLFDRDTYDNGRLPNGTIVVLDDQTYNDYGLQARAEYELLPTFKPFVQVTVDTRVHDLRLDQSGYARDSDGVTGQVGTTFELTHLLTGTIAGGYEDRHYDDHRLRDLQGPVIDASLAYAITPLTTIGFNADTSFNETDVAGASGAESHSFSLQVSHALLRNLTLTASAGYLNTNYVGTSIVENTYSGTLKASYNISRSIVLDASYNHETLKSTLASSSFTQDVFMVGLRLQH